MKISKFILMLTLLPVLSVAHAEINPISANSSTSVSQTPTDESLQKLMAVMQYDKNLDQFIVQNQEEARQWVNQSFQNNPLMKRLSPEQKNQFEQEKAIILQKMMNEQNTPAIRQQIITQYKEISKTLYTQNEVNAMIDFFSTPIGQSLRSKQGDFAIMTSQKIAPIARENQKQGIQKIIPELQKKLEEIAKHSSKKAKK